MKNTKILLINFAVILVLFIAGIIIIDKKITSAGDKQGTQNKSYKAKDLNLQTIQDSITANIEVGSRSVVSVIASKNVKYYFEDPFTFGPGTIKEENTDLGGGSGIIGSKEGYVITNKHVVEDEAANYSVITYDGKTYDVSKVWLDPKLDIAILKIIDDDGEIPANLEAATFASISQKSKIGQFVFAIGDIMSQYKTSITMGILSAKNREFITENSNLYIGLYQTDTSINPGNSGGPLLNINGEVIGINTAKVSFDNGVGFALPINQEFVDATINTIKQNGKISRPTIGFSYLDITEKNKSDLKMDIDSGIYVKSIESDALGNQGLMPGDIITQINENTIDKDIPFLYQLYTYKAGDILDLTIIRSGDRKSIQITLQ